MMMMMKTMMNGNNLNKNVVEVFVELTKRISKAKAELSVLAENHPEEYNRVRQYFLQCEEVMYSYCKCAPIKLIAGKVEEIINQR